MTADNTAEFDFTDLTPKTVPVKYAGKSYTLHEATETAAVQYRNAGIRAVKFSDEGKMSGVQGIASTEPLLVSLCLRDDKGNPVRLDDVLGWPARVVKPLYEWVKANSGLNEDDEDTTAKIDKEIARLTAKREKLVAGEAGPKEPPNDTQPTSD